jgi:ribose-phosphate pyrophosphokinase
MTKEKPMIFSGNSNRPLAKSIASKLGVSLGNAHIDTFSDGETRVKIEDSVRGKEVFIVQSGGYPANQNYMELFIILDAMKRAAASNITVVLPYFGYARQDRKDQPRVPISAKLVANLLAASGAQRVVALDLHSHQIQGFFDIHLDHLYAVKTFIEHIKVFSKNPVIVAPDAGSVKMATGFARRLGCDIAVIDKRRLDDRNTVAMNILGDVDGKDAIIVDDIIATGGSLVSAAEALKKSGAKRVFAAITHGVLSGPALERISDSKLEKILITDSILQTPDKAHEKIEVVSIAGVLAEAISRIHSQSSVSSLFS